MPPAFYYPQAWLTAEGPVSCVVHAVVSRSRHPGWDTSLDSESACGRLTVALWDTFAHTRAAEKRREHHRHFFAGLPGQTSNSNIQEVTKYMACRLSWYRDHFVIMSSTHSVMFYYKPTDGNKPRRHVKDGNKRRRFFEVSEEQLSRGQFRQTDNQNQAARKPPKPAAVAVCF